LFGLSCIMKYDVVVIGAGPAGSTAAKFLSEKGVKVLLIDKKKFPRDKPCGGAIPVRVLKRFKYIEEKDLIESYTYGAYLHLSSLEHNVEVQGNEPLFAMVLRKKFDDGLVKLAIDSEATFLDGKTAADIKIFEDNAKVMLDDGTAIESQIVIGADGVWSTIAKKSGLSQTSKNIGIGLFQEYPMSRVLIDRYFTEKRLAHLYTTFQGLEGYGWVFPKKDHVNIGIGEIRTRRGQSKGKVNLKAVYKSYIKILKENDIIPKSLRIGRVKGGAVPTRPVEKTYADRVLLCGDAAGLINPVTCDGINYAMSSGQIAANVTAEALESSDTREKFLSKYETIWKNDFGKDIKLFLRVQNQWGEKTEKFLKLVSRDKKISEMALGIVTGNLRMHKYRWKLSRRTLYLYLKDLLYKT